MKIASVSANGRITIPISLRKQYELKKGTRVIIIEHEGRLEIAKHDKNYFLKLAGILGTKGKMLKGLKEGKKKEII